MSNTAFVKLCVDLINESDEEQDEEIEIALKSLEKQPEKKDGFFESIYPFLSDNSFQMHFRMKPNAFEHLLQLIAPKFSSIVDDTKIKIPHAKQLLAVIWLLATPDSYRSTGQTFAIEKSTLSMLFFRIVDILCQLAPKLIKWPSIEGKAATKRHYNRKYGFRDLIGFVDGCYIATKVSTAQSVSYTNRKCFTSMTLQGICNEKMEFIDVFTGFPSSAHDARVFRNSYFFRQVAINKSNWFMENEYIFGDKAYPLSDFCITPFVMRRTLSSTEQEFNKRHSKARSIIERTFALLIGRFRRLKYLDMGRLDYVPKVILACCVLHNVCLKFKENVSQYVIENTEVEEFSNGSFENVNVDGENRRAQIINEMCSQNELL